MATNDTESEPRVLRRHARGICSFVLLLQVVIKPKAGQSARHFEAMGYEVVVRRGAQEQPPDQTGTVAGPAYTAVKPRYRALYTPTVLRRWA